MKTEGEFNSFLSKEFSRLTPMLKYLKASDRFAIGVSDFLLWYKGRSRGLECKFVKEIKSQNRKILEHPFSGAQVTFLEGLVLSGSDGFGLVGIKSLKKMYLLDVSVLIQGTNWKAKDFFNLPYKEFDLTKDGVMYLINEMFIGGKDGI